MGMHLCLHVNHSMYLAQLSHLGAAVVDVFVQQC